MFIAIAFSQNFPLPYDIPLAVSGLPTNCQHGLLENRDSKNNICL